MKIQSVEKNNVKKKYSKKAIANNNETVISPFDSQEVVTTGGVTKKDKSSKSTADFITWLDSNKNSYIPSTYYKEVMSKFNTHESPHKKKISDSNKDAEAKEKEFLVLCKSQYKQFNELDSSNRTKLRDLYLNKKNLVEENGFSICYQSGQIYPNEMLV